MAVELFSPLATSASVNPVGRIAACDGFAITSTTERTTNTCRGSFDPAIPSPPPRLESALLRLRANTAHGNRGHSGRLRCNKNALERYTGVFELSRACTHAPGRA